MIPIVIIVRIATINTLVILIRIIFHICFLSLGLQIELVRLDNHVIHLIHFCQFFPYQNILVYFHIEKMNLTIRFTNEDGECETSEMDMLSLSPLVSKPLC